MSTDIIGCKKRCEIMNRPAYIVLFKGDDSDFQGNQSVDIVIDTELDTTGMKAHFRFMDFVQDFDSIPEDKTLRLVFPHAKTSEFPLGAADATLRFEDASGKFRTVSNRIHIVVTNSVHEAYENEDSQSITVTVKGTVTWDMIEGKPDFPSEFPEPSDDEPLMDGEASAGESTEYSRGDHRHPSDTSKRDINDLGIRGEPQGAGSWFTVNGRPYNYDDGVWNNQYDSSFIDISSETYRYQDGDQGIEFVFMLDNGVYTGDGYVIIGYVDTLAEVSQIPSPSSSTPLMDGTSSSGSSSDYSRGDHVHPHDAAKLDGAAAYPAWNEETPYYEEIVSYGGRLWYANGTASIGVAPPEYPWGEKTVSELLGSKQDALTFDNSPTQNSNNPVKSSGVYTALQAKANATDLPYALVTLTPGPDLWSYSGVPNGVVPTIEWNNYWILKFDGWQVGGESGNETDTTVVFSVTYQGNNYTVTATRPSTNAAALLDRAVNAVPVSTDTTLTLPALLNAGKARDFLVRLEISGSTVPTITFAAPTGETIVYETDGDEFPVPDEAGTWLYSFTETAAHKFAVALKSVSVVTQGGV